MRGIVIGKLGTKICERFEREKFLVCPSFFVLNYDGMVMIQLQYEEKMGKLSI
jgi:hypothetical protein